MKVKVIHKIYKGNKVVFQSEYEFENEKNAEHEIKNNYKYLNKKDNVIREFSKDYLNYYNKKDKESHIIYIDKEAI